MATEISLGYHLYSIAKMLHQLIFLNGTLVNMETWPNLTSVRIEMFKRVELGLFRSILKTHIKTPRESIYLELKSYTFQDPHHEKKNTILSDHYEKK